MKKLLRYIVNKIPVPVAYAHCDGPCGVYDPASARIAAEAALSMSKKLTNLDASGDPNSYSRYVAIKEAQSELAKHEVLVLWTDYFKPEHLEKYPDLHKLVWETSKLCSKVKQHVDADAAQRLLENIKKIHEIFWETKDRKVEWVTTS